MQDVLTTNKEEFLGFDMAVKDHCLDAFYLKYLERKLSFSNFGEALKIILTFCHWQASVECGFSVLALIVESLQKESLESQPIVYDHMNVNGLKAHEIIISPALHRSVKSERQ